MKTHSDEDEDAAAEHSFSANADKTTALLEAQAVNALAAKDSKSGCNSKEDDVPTIAGDVPVRTIDALAQRAEEEAVSKSSGQGIGCSAAIGMSFETVDSCRPRLASFIRNVREEGSGDDGGGDGASNEVDSSDSDSSESEAEVCSKETLGRS